MSKAQATASCRRFVTPKEPTFAAVFLLEPQAIQTGNFATNPKEDPPAPQVLRLLMDSIFQVL